MNLVFVTTQREWGGSEPLWVETASRAAREGHEVTAVFPQDAQPHDGYAKLCEAGVVFRTRPARMEPTLLRRMGWKMQGVSKPEVEWWRRSFARTPDAVCVSQGGSYCALTLPGLVEWLLEWPCPYILLCHSHRSRVLPERKYVPQLQTLFRSASAVCFDAGAHAGQAAEFLGIELARAVTLQNPLRDAISEACPWPDETALRLACVGRLEVVDKGQDLLLEALNSPAWTSRDCTLDLFGSGPDEKMLATLIAKNDLTGRVHLAGFDNDVRRIWKSHHLLLLPSRSEGTPTSLIEAQLCGRPVLVTRVDGNPDWVEDGKTGFVAEAPTVNHVAAALERMWENRACLRQMGEAARKGCLAKRDPDPAGTLLGVLQHAAGQRK